MRTKKKRKVIVAPQDISKQEAGVESKKSRRRRLPLPVIRTGHPATLDLTNQKIHEILFETPSGL